MPAKIRDLLRLVRSRDPRSRLQFRQEIQSRPVLGWLWYKGERVWARLTQRSASGYLAMQKRSYELSASADEVVPGEIRGDFVAGSWREHNVWPDYEDYLMKYVPKGSEWLALEYGCGPGRNIGRWSEWFRRIDGVDISAQNLKNARAFVAGQIPPEKEPKLFLTEGRDCGDAEAEAYDFAFSTICLQHICVHEVRQSIFASLYRCLKPGGRLSAQMGFGVPSPATMPYDAEFYSASATNRGCDVAVADPSQLERDLEAIGFQSFESWVRPVGPGDQHPHWIFFTALKPAEG